MWFRRRRRQPPPLLLPSLDRLAELIERVVALLDEVSLAPERSVELVLNQHKHDAIPQPEPMREELVLNQHKLDVPAGWVAFVHSPDGYRLLQRDGLAPDRGSRLELDGSSFVVVRVGASPLPGDRRRCAYVERQERPGEARTFDR